MLYERQWRTCRGHDPLNMMGLSPVQKIKMVRSFLDIPYTLFYESMQRELCTLFIIPIFCMDS